MHPAAGQVAARQGQTLFLRQSGHAGEKAVEPQRIHVIGQAQGQGKPFGRPLGFGR